MESNVEHEGVHFTAPMKEPWDEYEMGGTADREEFRDSLHNTQHYCFKQKSKRASFALFVTAGHSIHQVNVFQRNHCSPL